MGTPFTFKNADELNDHFDRHQRNGFMSQVWGVMFGEIVMFAGDEGDVLSKVQFCPFCGVRLIYDGAGR